MYRLYITGIVHPERASVYYSPPLFKLEGVINGWMLVSIIASQVAARFDIEQTDIPNSEIYYYIEDYLSRVVNMIGFTAGCAYNFELINSLNDLTREHLVFGAGFTDKNKNPEKEINHELVKIQQSRLNNLIAVSQHEKSFYLFSALDDVKRAGCSFQDAGFYCYRAIESVMQSFKEEDDINENRSDKKAWEEMRSKLKITQDTILLVKKQADDRRHGKSSKMTKEKYDQSIEITISIINKFCEFLARTYTL